MSPKSIIAPKVSESKRLTDGTLWTVYYWPGIPTRITVSK